MRAQTVVKLFLMIFNGLWDFYRLKVIILQNILYGMISEAIRFPRTACAA